MEVIDGVGFAMSSVEARSRKMKTIAAMRSALAGAPLGQRCKV